MHKLVNGIEVQLTSEEEAKVLVEWKEGDKEIQRYNIKQDINTKLEYLNSTDWYVTRSIEKGVPVPAGVGTTRQTIREEVNALRIQLALL